MNQAQQGGSDPKTGAVAVGAPLLVLKGLDKRFGATHALKAVDLSFEAGEIHAIVGENGAGKSTLIKLLTGVHIRSAGEVYWEGQPVALATPHEAIGHGINAVHQEVPSSAFCSPRASASAMRPRRKDGNCRRSPPPSSVAPAFSAPSARCTGRCSVPSS